MEGNEELLHKLAIESSEHKARLDSLEKNQAKIEQDIRQLYVSQEGTKTLVGQVLQRFDGFEQKVFGLFQQMTKDSAQLLNKMTAGNEKQTEGWQKTIKDIIKLTVGALITYLFMKGVGK